MENSLICITQYVIAFKRVYRDQEDHHSIYIRKRKNHFKRQNFVPRRSHRWASLIARYIFWNLKMIDLENDAVYFIKYSG